MDKEKYIKELEELLQDVNEDERKEAIEFYQNYFEEAGKENEAKVIEELGNPQKIANTIKEGLKEDFEDSISSGNQGFHNQNEKSDYEVMNTKKDSNKWIRKWKELNERDKRVLIILIVLLFIPGLGGSLGVVLGIIISLFVIGLCPWLIAIGCYIIGIVMIVIGVLRCISSLGAGLLLIGGGILVTAVADALYKLTMHIFKKTIPQTINKIKDIISHIFDKVGDVL